MRARRTRAGRVAFLLLSAGLALSTADPSGASERSELLVAQGQVAYHRGRYEEARARFAEAAASDPGDATAHYELGLALLALQRSDEAAAALERALALAPDLEAARRALVQARREQAAGGGVARPGTEEPTSPTVGPVRSRKRWDIYAGTGIQYDSNVTIAPGGLTGEQFGDRDDVAFILSGGGRYDLIDLPNALVRVEYDLYQTLHPDLSDFDFRAHHVRGTASHALLPSLWAGFEGGYHHYTLGPHSYLSEPSVLPFVSLLEGSWGLTQVSYRYGYDTYLTTPFHDVRDGPSNAIGLDQNLYGSDGASYVTLGYQYGTENPTRVAGNDFELRFNQAYVGAGFAAWWRIAVDLMYLYRYDDYTHPNSFVDFRKRRHDSTHYFYASVARPLFPHVSVVVAYFGTIDYSNISLFEYHRNVVSAVLEVAY
jgi:hypothetical protein